LNGKVAEAVVFFFFYHGRYEVITKSCNWPV
jgi:hypothetical protein